MEEYHIIQIHLNLLRSHTHQQELDIMGFYKSFMQIPLKSLELFSLITEMCMHKEDSQDKKKKKQNQKKQKPTKKEYI